MTNQIPTIFSDPRGDAASDVVGYTDENGSILTNTPDVLGRTTAVAVATAAGVADAASDIVGYTDENGSIFTNTPDVLGRITGVAIAPAAGVAGNAALTAVPGTLALSFQFDGLSRPTFCRDSVGTVGGMGGLVNADVGFTRDSIDRVLEEQRAYLGDTRFITHNAFASYPGTSFTFPNGRQINKSFDALYRKNAINETSGGASIAAWQFFGGRIATAALGNGIVTSFMNNAQTRSAVQLGQTTPAWGDITTDHLGYDGAARPIGKRHILSDTTIVGFTAQYNPSSNNLFERTLHAESRSSLYTNDSMDRLLQYQRGVLATGGGSIISAIALPNTNASESYALDGLSNWSNTDITPAGGASQLQLRTHNKLNQVLAFGVAPAATPVLYDHGNNSGANASRGNGNIVNDGTRANVFDALNRLKAVNRVSDGHAVAVYVCDALGRRIIRTVLGAVSFTVPLGTSRYLLDGQQIVEELNAATGSPAVQYVWGRYIDALVQLKALTSIGPQPLSAGSYYLLSDLLYRSAALTNNTGGIVETYDTDAYGGTLLFSAGGGTGGAWWSNSDTQAGYSACRYVFTGREYDAETQLYFYRARYYGAGLGRFLSRDSRLPPGWNLYALVAGHALSLLDPSGLQATQSTTQPIQTYDSSVQDYLTGIAKQHGAGGEYLSFYQYVVASGCIGVVCSELQVPFLPRNDTERLLYFPDLTNCFEQPEQAEALRAQMAKDQACCKKDDPSKGNPKIFSMLFDDIGGVAYQADKNGHVPMDSWVAAYRGLVGSGKPTPKFDFGWPLHGFWYDANHYEVPANEGRHTPASHMVIFQNTDAAWRGKNYKRRLYCVACDKWPTSAEPPEPLPTTPPRPIAPPGVDPRFFPPFYRGGHQ